MTATTPNLDLASGFPAPSYEQWKAMVDKALKGADFDKRLVTRTADGIAIKPLYARKDALVSAQGDMPGEAPYTRGTNPVRFGFGWDIRTLHIEQDPAVANKAILEDLAGGVNSIALHVGANGLPATKDALAKALDGVLLDVCPIVLGPGEMAFDAATALNAIWAERGIDNVMRQGSYGCDPLGTLAHQGYLNEAIDTAMARAVALVETARPFPQSAR